MKRPIKLVLREYREDDISKFKEPVNITKNYFSLETLGEGEQAYDLANNRMVIKKNGKLHKMISKDNEIKLEEI